MGNISATYAEGDKEPLFFIVGGYGDGKCKSYNDTKAAVARMSAAGLSNVHFLDLAMDGVVLNKTATGCANHPSWLRNDMMAAIAVPKVRAALGWKSDDVAKISSLKCSLNGALVDGKCVCTKPWKGPVCAKLDIKPKPVGAKPAYGYAPNVTSWGGNVIQVRFLTKS